MRRLFWLALLGCVCLVATGCDPLQEIRGTVHTMPRPDAETEGDIYSSSEPISGAQIESVCPDDSRLLATSDEEGRFVYSRIGLWDTNCKIRVSHEDYAPQEFDIGELCLLMSEMEKNRCHRLAIQAELVEPKDKGIGH